MSKKFAVLLSGCGFMDGAEINESVFAMLHIDKIGGSFDAFAFNQDQANVVDHSSGKDDKSHSRNMLVEAARISRTIHDASTLNVSEYDALIIPGGFGVAKNFSNLATAGSALTVKKEVASLIIQFIEKSKPIGAICIAPAILAKVLHDNGYRPKITLGNKHPIISELGIEEIECAADEIVVDEFNKLVTTPAFMLPARLSVISDGIEKLIKKVNELC